MRRLLLLAALLWLSSSPLLASAGDRSSPTADAAEQLLNRMTPEERVGQLFVVTFRGSTLSPTDPIFDLITNGHISGVVLRARNDNFAAAPNTLGAAQALIAALQSAEYAASAEPATPEPGTATPRPPVYVPLFVAISQDGDGSPYSEIMSGVTTIPTEMAIGATWNPELARAVGEILGSELERLGINFLLGPSLDVLEDPRPEGPGDLGVRTFGGDPFWVSLMGEAYITGVHLGSDGRVAVVAKHFPGHGGSDRPLEEEVPTVRKSLEALERIELAPFFAVTDGVPGEDPGVTDALLRAHIRYQGFQDNIRATTRPVSLDPQAFEEIMGLEPLAAWRAGGGVTISDSLGSRAIRRFYDPRELTFRGHLVARDAFLAGNDLLYLSNFQSTGDADEATTIRITLEFFAEKYREDSLFAQSVDEAVLRILRLKLRLYGGQFNPEDIIPLPEDLEEIGAGTAVIQQVARAAATLINPAQSEIEDRLGGPPTLGERIVFITDVRLASQCTECPSVPGIDVRALETTVLRLYGPGGAGEVGGWNIVSFTMADLAAYFGEPAPASLGFSIASAQTVEEALSTANWIVFSVLGSDERAYGSNALKLLLDRRPDLAQRARLVVFAFGVPYDLDATDLSKVDVCYALYAKSSPFIEVAARLLFQEMSAPGASPVSVSGVGYDLLRVTSPDPDQVIPLVVRSTEGPQTPAATPEGYTVGDVVRLEAGVILDHNRHPVPDGTVVEFSLGYQGETVAPMILRANTAGGIATADIVLEQLGVLAITASSDPARTSEILQFDVREGVPAFVTVIAPTPFPTEPTTPTEAPVAAEPTPTTPLESEEASQASGPGFGSFILGMALIGMAAGIGERIGLSSPGEAPPRVRRILAMAIGGLVAFNYVALGLPGAAALMGLLGWLAGPLAALAGSVAGRGVSRWAASAKR
jgi:beta-N-acetylhexosaminidase